jgi:uncharacterized YccA/Bax inhibitor family protein
MMRTSNPTLNPSIFYGQRAVGQEEAMTIQGTINKCFMLFFLLLLSASWVWSKSSQLTTSWEYGTAVQGGQIGAAIMPYVFLGGIGGFILALITTFNRPASRITAPLYAVCEGLVLGGLSAIYELSYPGIVTQAVGLTMGTLFCMLVVYKSGFIKVDQKFILGLSAATGAICLVYFVSFILSFFGVGIPLIFGNGMVGIGFSLLVVAIAAFNLVLDFYVIEQGAQQGLPKYMEWYGAFALMVTLVWLYLEILRLLAKMRDRR